MKNDPYEVLSTHLKMFFSNIKSPRLPVLRYISLSSDVLMKIFKITGMVNGPDDKNMELNILGVTARL